MFPVKYLYQPKWMSWNSPQQVWGQNQAGVAVNTPKGKDCHSKGPRQARGMGQEEPHEIQQRLSPVPESD